MGEDITSSTFTNDDIKAFHERLRAETELLKTWFDEGRFSDRVYMGGSELEAWIVDTDCAPAARNDELLAHLSDPKVVPELSQFNIEFNTDPEDLQGKALSSMHAGLEATWGRAGAGAADMGLALVAIGILPTVRDGDMQIGNMSRAARYRALNDQVMKLRHGVPIHLDIAGRDHLTSEHLDVMLEAATTSFQIHIKVPAAEGAAFYNVAKILAAPTMAVAANSPYLFGRDLWDETRIPLFEQGVSMGKWNYAQRVTFGVRYLEDSLYEVFHANRQRYPVLLPRVLDDPPETMRHLLLHNSTIWRWVRAILGFDSDGTPHLRTEHRVIPAGPSTVDMIANAAFYFGLARRLAPEMEHLRWELPFADARQNFYAAAREGLRAQVTWPTPSGGRRGPMQDLVLEVLLPLAREGLKMLALDEGDVATYLGIIEARARTGRNGAAWQRAYVAENLGADMGKTAAERFERMRGLVAAYKERQASGSPVHEWAL